MEGLGISVRARRPVERAKVVGIGVRLAMVRVRWTVTERGQWP